MPAILLSGALGEPFLRDEVPFKVVEREHFDALAVSTSKGDAVGPLVVRVRLLGDAAGDDLGVPFAWLRERAGVEVRPDPQGAPLFLTKGDLAATSGRGTLGATLPSGMAVEMDDPEVGACVVVHEMLHFLGLKHVDDPRNIMYPHCSRGQLDRAELTPAQLDKLGSVERVLATTPGGVREWATRG